MAFRDGMTKLDLSSRKFHAFKDSGAEGGTLAESEPLCSEEATARGAGRF